MTEHTAAADFKRGDAFVICLGTLAAETKSGKVVADKLMEQNVFTERQYTRAKKIAAGEKITVLCVGDSITQGTGAKNQANNYRQMTKASPRLKSAAAVCSVMPSLPASVNGSLHTKSPLPSFLSA